MGTDFLVGPVAIVQGVSVLNEKIQTRHKEKIFYSGSGETLEQVVQQVGGYPTPGNINGQVGRGCEQPEAHYRGIELDDI